MSNQEGGYHVEGRLKFSHQTRIETSAKGFLNVEEIKEWAEKHLFEYKIYWLSYRTYDYPKIKAYGSRKKKLIFDSNQNE